jgi:hypothetical protein
MRSACWKDINNGCSTPGSASTSNTRLPRDNAMLTSAVHHTDPRYAEVTTQTTASAQRSRSCSRRSHSPHRNPITEIVIQEHLVALAHQPLVQLAGTFTVRAGMTDKDPGHHTSPGDRAKTAPHHAS